MTVTHSLTSQHPTGTARRASLLSALLRPALLLAALLSVGTTAMAQNAEQRAAMPDAFETMDPAAIIGDGKYYYIQFYYGSDISYLSDQGAGNALRSKDYIPFAKNLQWTLVSTGTDNQFKLKSLNGIWVYLDGTYKGTNDENAASTLTFYSHSGGGYDIGTTGDPTNAMAGNNNSGPWVEVYNYAKSNARCRLRVAKLKDNVAHIIYWQEPIYKDGNVVDRNTNTRGGKDGFTTHHYLTYSGTGNVISDEVSSRRSVLWYYDAWQLPTAAAYHQDGLWTLESAGENGEFYIKKYGTEEYLNNEQSGTSGVSVLGTKSPENGRYKLQAPNANRFTRIQNVTQYDNDAITTDMFYSWDGVGANANSTGSGSVESHIDEEDIGSGTVVIGAANVYYLTYANLTGYDKIVFQGTSGLELRVLLNRLEVGNGGGDNNGGAITERRCTIGADGMAEVDVSDLLFVHLNSIKVASGTGTVSSVTMVRPRYDRVSLATNQFYVWNGVDASATHNSETPAEGVVVNLSYAYPNQVIAGLSNASVYYTTYADLTGCTKIEFEATPGMVLRVLLNRQLPLPDGDQNGGPTIERIVTIDAGGRGEVELSDLPFVHLNAIKVAGYSPNGTVTAIRVLTPSTSGNALYLTCANTDGNHVAQRNGNPDDYWYAGFLPVEVPVPNKDEFYQVMVTVFGDNMLDYDGNLQTKDETNPVLWQLEQVDDYAHFRLKRQSTGEYQAGQGNKTQPNDPDGNLPTHVDGGEDVYIKAEVNDISKYFGDFAGSKWFYVNPVEKEFRVDYMVTHRVSYLKQYAQNYEDLDKQGLATGADSDWWNFETGTQKVNHFEITHYVKSGNSMIVEFPTVLNKSNDHVFYQRFYNYDEDKVGDVMDLDNLKAHVSLDTRDDGDVQYFLYRNGMVTGRKLEWTGIDDGGMARNAQRRFNFTNSDGQRFTVGVDVSRYSDLTYKGSSPTTGDLEEPSLTMRYIYYMRDAKEMAANLTGCTPSSGRWLETKTFHFPMKQIFYESEKKVGYRGEFIGLRHIFSDYWVFDGSGTDDNNLVSAVIDNTQGRIEVEIDDPHGTGIRLGGYNPKIDLKGMTEGNDADYQGFYFYDKMSDQNKTQYGDSRFVVFRYPASGQVAATGNDNPAYINVYLNHNGNMYQLAQFTVIFDPGTVTLPYTSVSGSNYVKAEDANTAEYSDGINTRKYSDRDPQKLIERAGAPIAKITFDYPTNDKYHFPSTGTTQQGWERDAGGTVEGSSPVPLTFDKTNYSFEPFECNWGSYSLVTNMSTSYGNRIAALPANDNTYGYGEEGIPALEADKGLQKAFLYIDASEQPGDICSAPFVGDFCAGDKLLFSGWISGSNKMGGGDNRCPGGITLTVKGEHNLHNPDGTIQYDIYGNPVKETVTLYRFCPGQIYELDNGTDNDGSNGANHVVWQQFYFEFTVGEKYDRHWIEVNNNCVSSQGGDFMLDNIAVYAIVPEVIPGVNTPLCVSVDDSGNTVTDMRLLKLSVDFNKQVSSAGVNTGTAELGFVFLDKEVFLNTFRTQLQTLSQADREEFHLEAFDFSTITLDALADAIEDGEFKAITGENNGKAANTAYRTAFDAAILGDKKTYYTKNTFTDADKNASIIYFEYNSDFSQMPTYSFAKAVNRTSAVYGETMADGDKFIVMNGNFPQLNWKANTDYYILISNRKIETPGEPFGVFNLCSECNKASLFRIEPPLNVLGLDKSEDTSDLEVCEGKIPTLLTDLKGYDLEGKEVPMKNLNFDWWLGDLSDPSSPVLATLANYHSQASGSGIRLDRALSTLRIYYPDATSLEGIIGHLAESPNPELTLDMVNYLQELVDKGQLVLHQKSISVPALKASDEDPYFYLVACPIHDEMFAQALNPKADEYVAYFCDEPQGLRIKVGEAAPTLKCGFVPNENGFAQYNYPTESDPVLSIRLAKRAQFETVKHGTVDEAPNDGSSDNSLHYLWLPIRNAKVQGSGSTGVIQKADDYNVYLASTDDPVNDKAIYKAMNRYDAQGNHIGSLPIVGKIVDLKARDTSYGEENGYNQLCIYFIEDFGVREGYSYTLSLPFRENNDANACDGTLLINLKIVPDYEVWTGGADNTDWNNDQNWRRADGNLGTSTDEPATQGAGRNNNELLRTATLPDESPLKEYVTNYSNYRTPKDRLLRKGFAPLYCTHVLIKSNEWGDAPVLYDALDTQGGKTALSASPFPNLRDQDGWDGNDATAATATPILRYDMQARLYDIWSETYGSASAKGRSGDLIAEMYQVNSCDEIAFQPGAELLNAHLLNYNSAWVEYELSTDRWYLLGSPLQGTISGEWYAPTGTAQQKTTYYEPVTFGEGYDRYSPAIYQRSWDKAKAVLYEIGSTYNTADNPDDLQLSEGQLPGSTQQGSWSGNSWDITNADDYLDRLGYKPLGGNKANVAMKGIWSNTYNDATVDYTNGAFSVMVMNTLKNNDQSAGKALIRLPKEDSMYDYYKFSETGVADGGTDTDLGDVQSKLSRAKNRGRLKSDLLLPATTQRIEAIASRYGDRRTYTRVPTTVGEGVLPLTMRAVEETVSAGLSAMGYYLVENPFVAGLDMEQFFAVNTGLEKKYWILTPGGQQLVQLAADGTWFKQDGGVFAATEAKVAPGQGFFVKATTPGDATTISFTEAMQAKTRYGVRDSEGTKYKIEVGRQQVTETVYVDADEDGTPDETVEKIVYEDDGVTPKTIPIEEDITIYSYVQDTGGGNQFPLKARATAATRGASEPSAATMPGLVITAERSGRQSSAIVMQREEASNDFLPEEDTETFINSDLGAVPTVYTLCGRLATTVNAISSLSCLPVGVESTSDAPCTLSFNGVEALGDSVALYDAVEQQLTPLASGMTMSVSGQSHNRYYLVRSLSKQDAAEQTHLQIFAQGLTATVIASTQEPLVSVRCYDTAGRLVYSATPDDSDHSFTLPAPGVYVVEAQTASDRKSKKLSLTR